MVDIATRFPRTTLKEAYELSLKSEKWVFDELICSSVTLLYGKSNVGKSYIVSSMVISLLAEGRQFLGMEPTDSSKVWRPVILWTDPGSPEEYGERIYSELPEDIVPMYHIGRTTRTDEWDALTDHLISEGHNFVVLDNLMGVTGDTNDSGLVTTVFDALTRLTSRGIPVVVLHHESEHGGVNPGAAPMGASAIVQKSRMWIQVRQSAKRGLRGGNTTLVVQGNALKQPQQLVAEPQEGPNYRVLNRGPWMTQKEATEEKPKQDRKAKTYDQNADMAQWAVDNCQRKGLNEAANMLAEKFDKSASTCKEQLMRGALAKLLNRQGNGQEAVWSLKVT